METISQKTYSKDEEIKITQAQPRKEEKKEADVEFIGRFFKLQNF